MLAPLSLSIAARPLYALAAAWLLVSSPPLAAATVPEARLKAAIVSKFAQFVEWPPAALDGRTSVDLCVVSPDPFGADLSELLAGESVNGRPLALRHISSPIEVARCHLLFVPAGDADGVHPLLAGAVGLPVLTVSDAPHFLDEGGMVVLRVVDGRVRFEIDDAAARRVGLRISSQLLRLALAVRGATP